MTPGARQEESLSSHTTNDRLPRAGVIDPKCYTVLRLVP